MNRLVYKYITKKLVVYFLADFSSVVMVVKVIIAKWDWSFNIWKALKSYTDVYICSQLIKNVVLISGQYYFFHNVI